MWWDLNSFHGSSLTNYVNYSTVAQNVLYLFKIPLNDAFLKGTVEIKDFRFISTSFPLEVFQLYFFSFFSCWMKKYERNTQFSYLEEIRAMINVIGFISHLAAFNFIII